MLWISDNKSDELNIIIEKLENDKKGNVAVCYKLWGYPLLVQKIMFNHIVPRKMNILEEFLMKSTFINALENISVNHISELLGLDEVFVNTCHDELLAKGLLVNGIYPEIELSKLGEECFKSGVVPDHITNDEVTFYFDKKTGLVYKNIINSDKYDIFKDYESMYDFKMIYNREFISEISRKQGKAINPNFISSEITPYTTVESYCLIAEIWIYNIIDQSTICKVWDYSDNNFRSDIEKLLYNKNSKNFMQFVEKSNFQLKLKDNLTNFDQNQIITEYKFNEAIKFIENCLNISKDIIILVLQSIDELIIDKMMLNKLKKIIKKNTELLIAIPKAYYTEEVEELLKELYKPCNEEEIPKICIMLIESININKLIVDDRVLVLGEINWVMLPVEYIKRNDLIYVDENKLEIKESQKKHIDIFIEYTKKKILNSDKSYIFLSELNFLYIHLSVDSFMELFDCLIEKTEDNKPDISYNLIVFGIKNNMHIKRLNDIIYKMKYNENIKQNIHFIISYMKLLQPNNFKELLDSEYREISKLLEEHDNFMNHYDYYNIKYIL